MVDILVFGLRVVAYSLLGLFCLAAVLFGAAFIFMVFYNNYQEVKRRRRKQKYDDHFERLQMFERGGAHRKKNGGYFSFWIKSCSLNNYQEVKRRRRKQKYDDHFERLQMFERGGAHRKKKRRYARRRQESSGITDGLRSDDRSEEESKP